MTGARASKHHLRRQQALPRQRHRPGFSFKAVGDPVPFGAAAEHQLGTTLKMFQRPMQIERAITHRPTTRTGSPAARSLNCTGILKRLGRLGVQG